MIIRRLEEMRGTACDVTEKDRWNSVRMLVARDGMGFSFHVTTIFAGASLTLCYRHHLEAVYCLSGSGELTYDEGRAAQKIVPGTLYALDRHDRHKITASEELRLVCVFNPAVAGHETHDAGGGYEPAFD